MWHNRRTLSKDAQKVSPARPQRVNKYDASKLARFRCPQDDPDESPTARNFLTLPPTGRHFSPAPPSDCFAIDFPRRAISPGEGLPIFPTSPPGERPDCPSLRASDEHSFIVRVLRARRMVWLLPSCSSETARCASTGDSPGHPSPAGGLFQHPIRGILTRQRQPRNTTFRYRFLL